MSYDAEVARIADSDGIIRDFPQDIQSRYALGLAMIAAGRDLVRTTFAEVEEFSQAVPLRDPEDPFSNMAPCAEQMYGKLCGDSDILESGRLPDAIDTLAVGRGANEIRDQVRLLIAKNVQHS